MNLPRLLHRLLHGRQAMTFLQPAVGLLVLALGTGDAVAIDRALHLHASPHAPASAKFAPTVSRNAAKHGRSNEGSVSRPTTAHRASESQVSQARASQHQVSEHSYPARRASERSAPAHRQPERRGSGADRDARAMAAPGKARGRDARRRQREPEPVDVPVTLHRVGHRDIPPAGTRKQGSRYEPLRAEARSPAPRYAESKEATRSEAAEVVEAKPAQPLPLHNPKVHFQPSPAALPASPTPDTTERRPSQQSEKMAAGVDAALHSANRYSASEARLDREAQLEREAHPDAQALIGEAITTAQPYRPSGSNAPSPAQTVATEAVVSSVPNPSGALARPRIVSGFGAEMASSPAGNGVRAPLVPLPANNLAAATGSGAAVRALADDAVQPMVLPVYTRSGDLIMPAPLKGSHDILVHQNVMADRDGLERIRNDRDLNRLRAEHALVAFPEVAGLRVNESLPENRRIARPWTVKFAADAAHAFYSQFGDPLVVSSAVRTVSYQLRLERVNGNAAAVSGEGASPHLTGQAIDLAKRSMTSDEIAWMRTYLAPFIEAGKIDVEEEFQQACFHISVYRAYMPVPRRPAVQRIQIPRIQVAQLHTESRGETTRADDGNNR